jgi:hypothetical protein
MSVVAAIRVFPVAHLPITDLLIGVQVIGEVAPSLGTGWNVNVSKVTLILLDHPEGCSPQTVGQHQDRG